MSLAVHRSSTEVPWRSRLKRVVCRLAEQREPSWGARHGRKEKKFFASTLWPKTLTSTEKLELEVLLSLDHSLVHVCSLCRWARAHWLGKGERESTLKKRIRKGGSGQPLFLFCFFRCTRTGGPVGSEIAWFYQWCRCIDDACGEHFLTIFTFLFPFWSTVFIFQWFICFFSLSRIDFQKNLDEKHKKTNVMPLVYHTLIGIKLWIKSIGRCFQRTRSTLLCEVIRYRLVQVPQSPKNVLS